MESEFRIGGESHTVSIDATGTARIDGGEPFALESTTLEDGTLVLVRDGKVHRAVVARGEGGEVHVTVNGAGFVLETPVLVPDRPGEAGGESKCLVKSRSNASGGEHQLQSRL